MRVPRKDPWRCSSGNLLRAPLGICEGYGSCLFVADATGRISQVHSQTGRQRLVSNGGNLVTPVSIAYHGGQLYVTEITGRKILLIVSDPDCNNFAGALIRIELANGSQECLISGFGDYVNPRGVLLMNRK